MLHAKLTKHAHESFRPNLKVQPPSIYNSSRLNP
jgi:hypothetical protein